MKKCGYSFWGYLGDMKYDRDGNEASTPDGNAFYSWCIIRELQKRGYEVTQIMPDRDEKGYELRGDFLFSSWIESERVQAYIGTKKSDWWDIIDKCRKDIQFHQFNAESLKQHIKSHILGRMELLYGDMEFILHEFRMQIYGRNDLSSIFNEDWQPDYLLQECIFDFCIKYHKKLIIFDLDYNVDYRVYGYLREKGCPVTVFELGNRWLRDDSLFIKGKRAHCISARQVFIPFDFDNIDYYSIPDVETRKANLTYVGNRYERDWCIDKYIPPVLEGCMIYGNWLEGNRDSKERWSNLHFGQRLQTRDMRYVYSESVVTILLAKEEYCEYDFMTARIIEAIFYGTVPLFIEEYGEETIKRYAGDYADFLTVRNAMDVCRKVETLRNMSGGAWINVIVEYMRDRLKFMDVKNFVNAIEEVVQYGL